MIVGLNNGFKFLMCQINVFTSWQTLIMTICHGSAVRRWFSARQCQSTTCNLTFVFVYRLLIYSQCIEQMCAFRWCPANGGQIYRQHQNFYHVFTSLTYMYTYYKIYSAHYSFLRGFQRKAVTFNPKVSSLQIKQILTDRLY